MSHVRLTELATRHRLSTLAVDQLERLLARLGEAEWAPTTVTKPAAAVDVHIADSLAGLEVDALRRAERVADLGSGAGFPALVLAIVLPQARVVAVESARRKCAFMADMAGALELQNFDVACCRVEEWAAGGESNDVVCARAVAPLGVLLEYSAPLLRLGGSSVAWKGHMEEDEIFLARAAAAAVGLSEPAAVSVRPYKGSQRRQLVVSVKEKPTPERFPRRTGVALKRPLGA